MIRILPSLLIERLSVGKQIALSFGVPLAFVAGLSLALLSFDQQSLASEQVENKKRLALEHLERISNLSGDSFAGLFADTSDEAIARSDHMKDIRAELSSLTELLKEDKAYAADLQQLTTLLDKEIEILFYLHSRPGRSIGHALETAEVKETLANYAELSRAINLRIARETKAMETLESTRLKAYEHLRAVLTSALYASILIAVTAGILFFRHLQKRLLTVTSNVELLASGSSGAELSKYDELGYLNESLIETFDKLFTAQRKRQEVVQMVTHDLRSPLSAIGASIDNMLRGTPETVDSTIARLTSIKKQTQRMSQITEDFLLLEKLDNQGLNFKQDEIDLRSTVSECIAALIDKSAEKNLCIRNRCGEYLFVTDEGRFNQILTNLLTNAIKVSPPGAEIEVSAQERKDFLQFSVLDLGPGIEASELPKLFDRFYQPRNSESKGFGVGLFIVKALVQGQGGSVGIESKFGTGTRFWFTLPYKP